MNKKCDKCKYYNAPQYTTCCIKCDNFYDNKTELANLFESKNQTPTRDMLKEILFLACDEVETREQHVKDGAEYDIVASKKDLKDFEEFINKTYLNISNAIQYAINELHEWNEKSEAATKLGEILKSIQ